jgi:hypothetical protein
MLINPQVHGIAAAYAPVLHLRQVEPAGMFATYADSFDRRLDGSRAAERPGGVMPGIRTEMSAAR